MSQILFINNVVGLNYHSGIVNRFVPAMEYHIKKHPDGSYKVWFSHIYYAWVKKYSFIHLHYSKEFTYSEVDALVKKTLIEHMNKHFAYLLD